MTHERILLHSATALVDRYANLRPCPFCGSPELRIWSEWREVAGTEVDVELVECRLCLGAAPAETWNQRQRLED